MGQDLEARLAALEESVRRLEERAEQEAASRSRGLWIRVALLVALALAYMYYFQTMTSLGQ